MYPLIMAADMKSLGLQVTRKFSPSCQITWPRPSRVPTPLVPFCALRWQLCLSVRSAVTAQRRQTASERTESFSRCTGEKTRCYSAWRITTPEAKVARNWSPEGLKVMQVVMSTPTFSWWTLKMAKEANGTARATLQLNISGLQNRIQLVV